MLYVKYVEKLEYVVVIYTRDNMEIQELKVWCYEHMYLKNGDYNHNLSMKKWYIKRELMTIYEQLIMFKTTYNLSKISEVAYWLKNGIAVQPTCEICNTPLRFYGKRGYGSICGIKNCRKKYHESVMLSKYGFVSYTQTPEFKMVMVSKRHEIEAKKKETSLSQYGVDNPMKSEMVKKKLENTMIEKYGFKTNLLCLNDESTKKRNATFNSSEYRNSQSEKAILRYNNYTDDEKLLVKNKHHSTMIKNSGTVKNAYKLRNLKSTITFFKKYKVHNAQQVPEIHEKTQKNRYKFKDYILPSGKIVHVQGYEDKALKYIFTNNLYGEDYIILNRKNMPEIWYFKDDKQHRYFPDIFIPAENKIIEVKSNYTLWSSKTVNYQKRDACLKLGFLFEFWIFSGDQLTIL